MAGDWETTLLRDLLVTTKDGDWGKENPEDGYVPYHIIRGTDFPDVRVGDLSSVPQRYLPEHTVKRRTLEPDDILIETAGGTRDRPTGRTLLITEKVLSRFRGPVTCASFARFLRIDRKQADPRFVFWYLQHLYDKGEMSQHQVQHTGVARFQYTRFAETQNVPLPPLAEQKAIAAVLGALDDKIELNRRMNATLEAMARALFQSWFVDFDPVRAKLDGRKTVGMDASTADLFPSTFDETEVGHIPQGWKVTTLGEACENGGGNIQTGPFGTQLHASDYVDEGIPSIMPSDLRDNRIDTSSIARIREQDAERLKVYRVQAGDVVYSRRGDVERRSLIRRGEHGWLCGTGCLRVRFGPRGLNPFFGASYLGTLESRAWVVRHAVGATMPNLNTSILGALPMIVPPPELQARFAEIVGPWDERGTIALEQSRTLATLRDTLLPKLLSGELSVAETSLALKSFNDA